MSDQRPTKAQHDALRYLLDHPLVITTGQLYVASEQVYPTTGGAQVTIKKDTDG